MAERVKIFAETFLSDREHVRAGAEEYRDSQYRAQSLCDVLQ
jgi:hypothetical protein